MKQNKKRIIITTIFILTLFITVAIINTANSRYKSDATGEYINDIAAWKIKINGEISTSLEIPLEDTIIENSYTSSHIIPGTEGKIPIIIDSTGTQVAFKYQITLNTSKTTKPANLKLYTDSSYTTELSTISENVAVESTGEKIVNVYWKWLYTTTNESNSWENEDIKIVLDINTVQIFSGVTS